jgi:SAM-dependent methyltransferase
MEEIKRLAVLGWEPPPADDFGVRWGGSSPTDISYPRDVLGTDGGNGGDGFWLDARGNAVGKLCRLAGIETLWDIGAGSGAMASRLKAFNISVVSVEPLPEGARSIARMGCEVFCSTLQDLNLPDRSLQAIGLFDVIEHLKDPTPLLSEVSRVLSHDGLLFITVPAHQWLWSAEDEALGHFRRYSPKHLATDLEASNLQLVTLRRLFASLVPIAAVLRTLPYRLGMVKGTADEVLHRNTGRLKPGPALNRMAAAVSSMEAGLSRVFSLPVGLSMLAVARPKSGSAHEAQ